MMAPRGEDLGVGGEHRRGHRPAGRQARDVDAPGIEGMAGDHPVDHLPDREGLAGVAAGVAGREPVEAAFRVVGPPLLRQQQGEAEAAGEVGPAAGAVEGGRALGAAVQDDDQRRAG